MDHWLEGGNIMNTAINRITNPMLASLARDIAMSFDSIDDVLKSNGVTSIEWEKIQLNPIFVEYLKSEIAAWQGASNAEQRIKLKASALIEEWLQIAGSSLQNEHEPLSSRTDLAKLLTKLAGLGERPAAPHPGEMVRVTINLGSDVEPIVVEKAAAPKLIEHDSSKSDE
jgi:hypothetical protein